MEKRSGKMEKKNRWRIGCETVNPPHGGALSSGGEVEENYIIAYDLPSENYKHIVNTEAYVKVCIWWGSLKNSSNVIR